MAVVVPWQQLFGVALRSGVDFSITTNIADAPSILPSTEAPTDEGEKLFFPGATATGSIGIPSDGGTAADDWKLASEVYGVPVTNRPTFEPGQEINEYNKAVGESVATAGTGYNFMKSYMMPTTTVEFDLDRRTALPFLFAFFQAGSSEAVIPVDNESTAAGDRWGFLFELPDAADGPSPDYFISMFKTLDFPSGELITDAVCTSMTLSGSANEPLKVSFELLGHMFTTQNFLTWTSEADGFTTGIVDSAGAVQVKFAEQDPYHWNNVDVAIGNVVSDTGAVTNHRIVECSGFELTITAATTARRYNSRNPMRFVNNGYSVEGSITIPYGTTYGATNGLSGDVLSDFLIENTTSVFPVPIDLCFFDASIGAPGSTPLSTTAMGLIRDMTTLEGSGVTETTSHVEGDLHIGVGAVLKSVPSSSDDETMVTVNFTGANIRDGNAISLKAMRMAFIEGAGESTAADESCDYLTLSIRPGA